MTGQQKQKKGRQLGGYCNNQEVKQWWFGQGWEQDLPADWMWSKNREVKDDSKVSGLCKWKDEFPCSAQGGLLEGKVWDGVTIRSLVLDES